MNTSSFHIGSTVELTNNFGPFLKGDRVTVVDNMKRGSLYKIKVEDRARGIVGDVPKKYLKASKTSISK